MSRFIFYVPAPEQEDSAEEVLSTCSRLANFIMTVAQLLLSKLPMEMNKQCFSSSNGISRQFVSPAGFHSAARTFGQKTKSRPRLLERRSPAKVTSIGSATEN